MSQLRRSAPALRPHAAALLLLAAAAACGGGGDGTTGPGGGSGGGSNTKATVTVPAQITVPANSGALAVQVAASYDRQGGATGALGVQTVNATAGTQTLPITVDLASCLADTTRAGGAAATTCGVRLQLTLTAGGAAVDAQDAGPFALAAGTALTSPTTVTFAPVASVQVAGAPAPARALVGTPLPLTAQALDAAGNVLAKRAVRWSSDAPGVATVDSLTGVVTPVAAGSATITATVAGQKGARTVTVVAPPQPVTVTVAGGTGGGSITSVPAGLAGCRAANGSTSGTCAANFPSDSAVTLTAVPDQGVTFGGWGGDCAAAGTAATCTLTPNGAKNVTVAFLVTNRVAVTLSGSGNGTVTTTPAGTLNCRLAGGNVSGTCSVTGLENATITLTAAADAGSTFAGWSGPCTGTAPTCTVPLTQAQAVGAVFSVNNPVTVTVQTAGDASGLGGGYVSSAQVGSAGALSCHRIGGITSGAVCSTQYGAGAQVTLTASPDAISTFAGWSGPCSGSGTTCTFTIGSSAVTPVARFAALASANGATVAPAGTGSGSLTITTSLQSAPCTQAQVNQPDGGTCVAPWTPANVPPTVTIRAFPAAGSRFTGWTGCPAGGASGTTCTVSRNGTYAVSASFDP